MGCGHSQNDQATLNLSKPHVYFVSGGPGSGKGTQCQMLVRDYRFKHLSVGDLLRQQQKKGGALAQQLKQLMEQGKLVSSELVVKLIKKSLAKNGNRRYLIDGFPRNMENIEKFIHIMKDQVVIKPLIFFNCSTEVMTQRILKRAQSSGRVDDNPETIKLRIATYEQQSLPVIKKFQHQKKIIQVNAENSKQKIYEELKQKLAEHKVYPPNLAQVIFVLGGPGSGKGTQCELLVKEYGFRHLSTGDLLRQAVKNGSEKGKQIEAYMKEGKLVSSELLVGLIEQNMERYNFAGRYLLDGFPRGQDNINAWNKILEKWTNLKGILYFKCEQEELIRRLLDRGKTSGRVDDNEATIKKRLDVFNNETNPVIETYSKQGKVIEINANRSIQEIFQNVQEQLGGIGIFPRAKNDNNPKVVCVLGGPGSGKGTQCDYLKKQFGFKHLSTGDLLREQQKNDGLYAQLLDEYLKEGRLVPSEILVLLIKKKLSHYHKKDIFLLDGFPRNQENIDKWEQIMGADLEFSNIIYFECSEKVMEERLMNRGKTSGRSDDNAETIKKRLNVFNNESVPVVKRMQKKDKFVVSVSAQDAPDKVFANLKAKLKELGYKTV